MKELLFLIPMKDPRRAKSRLSAVMPDGVRARLAMALYRRMLGFLTVVKPDVDILVVSDSAALAREVSDVFFIKQSDSGLNAAITEGAAWAKAQGYASICVLPADLADPAATELERLLALEGRGVVLAPAHDGGTNALMVTPPDAISFCFGRGSCSAHQRAAQAAGMPCTIIPLESLKYDIDTSSDLARIRGVSWA